MAYTYKLGAGLIPGKEGIQGIYSLARSIRASIPLSSAALPGKSIPHMTLFQGKYESEEEAVNALASIRPASLPSSLQIMGARIWAQKIIFLDLEKTEKIMQAHRKIFKALFPLCEGKSADPQDFQEISREEGKSYQETGYPFSLDAYSPHITLGHAKGKPGRGELGKIGLELAKAFPKKIISFEKLVVYEVGPLGACKSLVYERRI